MQVHRLEATLRGNREALEVEVHATEAQAERLKGEVAALRSVACDTLAESEARMQELQAHCDSAVRWGPSAATEGQQCELEGAAFRLPGGRPGQWVDACWQGQLGWQVRSHQMLCGWITILPLYL